MKLKYAAFIVAAVMVLQIFAIPAFADGVAPRSEIIISGDTNRVTSFSGLTDGVTTGTVESGKIVFSSTHSDGWKLFEAHIGDPIVLSEEELEYAYLDFDIQTTIASGSNAPYWFQLAIKDRDGNNTAVNLYEHGVVNGGGDTYSLSIPLKSFNNVAPTLSYFAIHINDWSAATVTISNMSVNVCPSELKVLDETQETQIVSWDAVPGASSYYVFRNGYFIGETTNNYAESKGLLPQTKYEYRVSAKINNADVFCTKRTPFKTPVTLTESYEIPFFKSGMKTIAGTKNINYSMFGSAWMYVNDPNYEGVYETGRPMRVVSWGWPDFSQFVFSESIDTSDENKYNNTALSFMAKGAGQGKTGEMGYYFFTGESTDPSFYSWFSVPTSDTEWHRYDIPLSKIRLNNGFLSMLVGGNNTELLTDNVRFTSINPEIVTVMLYDENDSVILPKDGVYDGNIKKCRVRFNRELDKATISGVDAKVNGKSIVGSRSYDDRYCEVTMTLADVAPGSTVCVSTSDTVLSAPAIGAAVTNGGSTGTSIDAGAQPAIESSRNFSVKANKINYYKVVNSDGIDIAPTILFPMTVKAEMEKGLDNCGDMTLILAVYDSNTSKLKNIKIKNVLSGDAKGVYQTDEVKVVKGDRVRIFVFNNLTDIVPVVQAK